MLGQHKADITIAPYQSGWQELYERETGLLRGVLGDHALRIEHIGSTSIPGMPAKPVIDIMVAVASLTEATKLIPLLKALGYQYRTPDTVPERMFFAKECAPEVRTHHLNLVQQASGFWRNQIAFRDYLRTHSQTAIEYADLKKHLAETYAQTHRLDRDGKTAFVASVLELAAKEEYLPNP